jgi:YidC/Oxa1 family membrane protein insertase
MDIKRNLLIAGLAIVSYLLLLAWQEDFSTPQVSDTAAPAPTVEIPTLPATPGPAGNPDDIPQVQGNTTVTSPASVAPATLITVTTPTQVVSIDPVGGDIVGVMLPAFPTSLETPQDPFVLMRNESPGLYVAQSGLIGRNGPDAASAGRPVYQATQTQYTLTEAQLTVDLVTTAANAVQITKRFIFDAQDYLITIQYLIANNGSTAWAANLYGQIKRDRADDPSAADGFAVRTFLGAVLTAPDDPYKKVKFDDIDDAPAPLAVQGGWIGFSQHYFLGSFIAPPNLLNTYTTRRNSNGEYLMGFVSPETVVPAGTQAQLETALWAGPKDQYRLEDIAPGLGRTIDYGMLWFVGYPIFWLLTQINALVGNYGLAIILLTLVIKLLFFPLSAKQFRSQANMKRLQPKINQLKERYGDDKQKFMQAQMELWKKEKVNPFGGCLPVLLQMPVFLGIYWVLNESVELRQAPFILWYQDLSALDSYFILPLLLGAAYYLQQHMTPMMTTDPTQARIMKFMPVMFTVFFLWFPAGLVLYYLVNALLTILQQWYFSYIIEKRAAPVSDG